ncbi:MAG: tyrosine-type recombinase/integrase [Deltaproteobacteria bacterium]|nr:tyrosine-type recombinase/integrase [Deltaproteobacteria bacterium]
MKRNKGLGRVYQPSFRDRKTGELRYSPTWWIALSRRGKRIQISSHSTKRADAVKLLTKTLGKVGAGRPVGSDVDRITFQDLLTILVDNYKANRRRSLDKLNFRLSHLNAFFGMDRAIDVTADRIDCYVAHRLEQGAANATINRELSALKRAFHLASKAHKVGTEPEISLLHEDNARTGFFEEDQYHAVLAHLPEDLKPVIQAAYVTGWRVHSEILTRQKRHLDLDAGWLRLEPGEAKNQKGRMFALTPELDKVLRTQLERTRILERETGRIVPWLFHRDGNPIKDFRHVWKAACTAAGIPGRIPHDFRRTAVRNLERAGVSQSAAMAMTGHLTDSVYRRYAIVDQTVLKEGAAKLAALHELRQRSGESPSILLKQS